MEKLGIHQEGILRKHMTRFDGSQRDSVIFSVTVDDWPAIKEQLLNKL